MWCFNFVIYEIGDYWLPLVWWIFRWEDRSPATYSMQLEGERWRGRRWCLYTRVFGAISGVRRPIRTTTDSVCLRRFRRIQAPIAKPGANDRTNWSELILWMQVLLAYNISISILYNAFWILSRYLLWLIHISIQSVHIAKSFHHLIR